MIWANNQRYFKAGQTVISASNTIVDLNTRVSSASIIMHLTCGMAVEIQQLTSVPALPLFDQLDLTLQAPKYLVCLHPCSNTFTVLRDAGFMGMKQGWRVILS